ncbi:hypothetical protein [Anaeromyxobacter sp. Fw109-5]|uniref:hypothetical protein n=1 Tax=Anaeromyxobacter sp. (strain Fw109-5) TaxID=404589 RepID=UPI0000ED7025|nr:hypothetical protein [Anaeromyxobacter sp. Fw109-5]ABS27957.1 hypothetical protein Anae109_3778 [Anaeromyxobacter sp. Fw109-5]
MTTAGALDPVRRNAVIPATDGVARFLLSRRGVSSPRPPPSVLVLARPGAESDDLFADLSQREDVCLLRVATEAAASVAIREIPVALVIACPQASPAAVDSLLAHLDAARPGTPVLAIRARQAQVPPEWGGRGVAVLRLPLLSGVLSRAVDVVLGMTGKL